MGPVMFSTIVGIVAVIVAPVAIVLGSYDIFRSATRDERLEQLQVTTLASTTMLFIWTYFWGQPSPDYLMIAPGPLWLFCGIGVAISTALGLLRLRLRHRRLQLEARLLSAICGR